jgi:hypothetical protein
MGQRAQFGSLKVLFVALQEGRFGETQRLGGSPLLALNLLKGSSDKKISMRMSFRQRTCKTPLSKNCIKK